MRRFAVSFVAAVVAAAFLAGGVLAIAFLLAVAGAAFVLRHRRFGLQH
jgi:hypothetical protein